MFAENGIWGFVKLAGYGWAIYISYLHGPESILVDVKSKEILLV